VQHGQIGTLPPLQLSATAAEPVKLRESIAAAFREHSRPVTLPGRIRAVHRERRRAAATQHSDTLAEHQRLQHEYERACERARERHLRRHGFVG
jgi:hypothetical protein